MKWLIVLIALWVVWRFITATPRREAMMKDAIGRAFIASDKLGQEWIDTPIYWEAAEKFATMREARMHNDGAPAAHFEMKVNGEEVSVILLRDSMNGRTKVSARKTADVIAKAKASTIRW